MKGKARFAREIEKVAHLNRSGFAAALTDTGFIAVHRESGIAFEVGTNRTLASKILVESNGTPMVNERRIPTGEPPLHWFNLMVSEWGGYR